MEWLTVTRRRTGQAPGRPRRARYTIAAWPLPVSSRLTFPAPSRSRPIPVPAMSVSLFLTRLENTGTRRRAPEGVEVGVAALVLVNGQQVHVPSGQRQQHVDVHVGVPAQRPEGQSPEGVVAGAGDPFVVQARRVGGHVGRVGVVRTDAVDHRGRPAGATGPRSRIRSRSRLRPRSVNAQTVVPAAYSPAEVTVSLLGSVQVRSRRPPDRA